MGFPGGATDKELACQCRRCKRHGFDPWARKIPCRRAWQSTPVFLPGEFHGQRNLADYSPWTSCVHAYKWKKVTCIWIGRINSIKMFKLPRAIYKFNAISVKMPIPLSTELE